MRRAIMSRGARARDSYTATFSKPDLGTFASHCQRQQWAYGRLPQTRYWLVTVYDGMDRFAVTAAAGHKGEAGWPETNESSTSPSGTARPRTGRPALSRATSTSTSSNSAPNTGGCGSGRDPSVRISKRGLGRDLRSSATMEEVYPRCALCGAVAYHGLVHWRMARCLGQQR